MNAASPKVRDSGPASAKLTDWAARVTTTVKLVLAAPYRPSAPF
jgi:hypothetical protein